MKIPNDGKGQMIERRIPEMGLRGGMRRQTMTQGLGHLGDVAGNEVSMYIRTTRCPTSVTMRPKLY